MIWSSFGGSFVIPWRTRDYLLQDMSEKVKQEVKRRQTRSQRIPRPRFAVAGPVHRRKGTGPVLLASGGRRRSTLAHLPLRFRSGKRAGCACFEDLFADVPDSGDRSGTTNGVR